MKPWCVAWLPRDTNHNIIPDEVEWCTCRAQPKGTKRYQDHIPTKCGMVVTLPCGIKHREPTCPECKKKLSRT